MTRAFDGRPVSTELLHHLVSLASRAPSAGKTQGWDLVVLKDAETAAFWDVTLPLERRGRFGWPDLLAAPVIAIAFADPSAYVQRYSEADKVATGLGSGVHAWPTPYWTIDAAMSVNTLLLAAEDAGLGALFFGVFNGESELRESLGVPDHLQLLGAIALGWPLAGPAAAGQGRSASRPRRTPDSIVHVGGW